MIVIELTIEKALGDAFSIALKLILGGLIAASSRAAPCIGSIFLPMRLRSLFHLE